MDMQQDIDIDRIAKAVGLPAGKVKAAVELLDAENTVPFITRYRKDQTGGLDEEQIRAIESELGKQRMLAERKQTILRSIESQGKLTDALAAKIQTADNLRWLEDLYLPYKPKKQTRATIARERGLGPLAEEILKADPACADLDARAADFVNPDREVANGADALLGTGHILAERFSERADLRHRARKIFRRAAKLVSAKASDDDKKTKPYRDYFEFTESIAKLPPHRVLAINRGEKAKALRVRIEADQEALIREGDALLVTDDHTHADFLRGCVRDALVRLIVPSLEREVRRELTETAETHAVEVFARNLRNLLLQPPIRDRRVLAIDPGFKSGCKLVALDEFGNLLVHEVVYLVGSKEKQEQSRERLAAVIREHNLSLVAIGNGTACRETEEVLAELIAGPLADQGVAYVVVNEAGASVYSASPLAREELPQYDATVRGAISIGRRLQDPLSELVKIDPASIGVGMYQHDVKAKHLQSSLDAVVQSCVNYVGVDLNTASPALLRYVSGLNALTARRVYDHRQANGPFRSRQQLLDIQGFGQSAFVQSAGFLKITAGDNPLDATWIHPESYTVAQQVLAELDYQVSDLAGDRRGQLSEKTAALDKPALSGKLQVGQMLLEDILANFDRPGRDPREGLPLPIFRKGVVKLEDLQPGMELAGTVLNVVDFGAFVDIGLSDSGLVHISQIANRYVRDPHEVVAVGDVVKVWVQQIDKDRRRVGLTMIEPGTEAPAEQRSPRKRRPPRSKPDKPKQTRGSAAKKSQPQKPPRKPKPVAPLTDAMRTGAEPMRTFGDLAQFYQQGEKPEKKSGKKPRKNSGNP